MELNCLWQRNETCRKWGSGRKRGREVNLKLAGVARNEVVTTLGGVGEEDRKGQLSKFLGIGTLFCNTEHSDNTLHGKHVYLFMNHVL